MSKLPSFLILMLFFLYILPLSISEEETNYSTDNLNNTNENEDQEFFFDKFNDYDFGNLIWIDDTNATSELEKYELLYLMFYTPWCEPCHLFFPEFIAASKYAEENNLKAKFAKIDVSKSQNISENFDIQGVP